MNFFQSIFISFLASCSSVAGCNKLSRETFNYKLGNATIQLERLTAQDSLFVTIVHLHNNEVAAKAAAEQTIQQYGGTLLSLENKEHRLVKFNFEGQNFLFDPNRMFTKTGRKNTLTKLSRYHEQADVHISNFAAFFLSKIPESKTLISVHNNTNSAYSILSYASGGNLQNDAAMLHQNGDYDADDFFITTDAAIFNYLKDENYNVVLQHNTRAVDDGSLSIFYGRHNKSYVNVEAEHGHVHEQKKMLGVLAQMLKTGL